MKNYSSKKLALLLTNIHGSGIDCDYTITESKQYVKLSNCYHVMDENGFYDGYFDFTVWIKKGKVYKITFSASPYHRNKYVWLLRDYLEGLFFDPMELRYEKSNVRDVNFKY